MEKENSNLTSPPVIDPPGPSGKGEAEPASNGAPSLGRDRRLAPIYLLATWLGLLLGARMVQGFHWPLPKCGLRTLTGIPCPLCGTTRCLSSWSRFEFAQAFRYNPGVALLCGLLFTWALFGAAESWLGRDWLIRLPERFKRRPWPAILIGAAVLNWIYLILCLPK